MAQSNNLIVKALAGTGKTSTMIWSLGTLPKGIVLSQEQLDIRNWIQSTGWETCRMVAFNKSIATELQTKVPTGVEAGTCHSVGLNVIKSNVRGYIKVNGWKYHNILNELFGDNKDKLPAYYTAASIIDLARSNLMGYTETDIEDLRYLQLSIDDVQYLRNFYDLNSKATDAELLNYVNGALKVGSSMFKMIDFADMIWMPVFHDFTVKDPVDLVIVDECQDLNHAQQKLVLNLGKRVVCIGDAHQAIYGFAGADANSMNRLETMLGDDRRGGVDVLPLNTTRRCGKAIVAKAQTIVKEYRAADSNGDGEVLTMTGDKLRDQLQKDFEDKVDTMVVCRTNAPIVMLVFSLLKRNIVANIQGRDIGQGLISLVKKLAGNDMAEFMANLEAYESKETIKLQQLRWGADEKLVALQDKCDCIRILCDGMSSLDEVIQKITDLFKDTKDKGAILLSSVHRAKGLEAEKVYIVRPDLLPHPKLVQGSLGEQEYNLHYVAITRAIKTLIYVQSED